MAGAIWGFYLWSTGVFPALYRLGNGLAKRKVAVFAKNEQATSLVQLLTDSGLFKKRNIEIITRKEDIGRAERASVYLLFWPEWKDCIDDVLSKKPDSCPLIVYAPRNRELIPEEDMIKLDGHRHTAVTNFRARLLNDMVTAMITTSYEKK